jgi:hypothetical protein
MAEDLEGKTGYLWMEWNGSPSPELQAQYKEAFNDHFQFPIFLAKLKDENPHFVHDEYLKISFDELIHKRQRAGSSTQELSKLKRLFYAFPEKARRSAKEQGRVSLAYLAHVEQVARTHYDQLCEDLNAFHARNRIPIRLPHPPYKTRKT